MSPLSSTAKYRQLRNKKLVRLTAVVLLIMTILSSIGSLPSNAASGFSISGSTLSATSVEADGKIVMNIVVSGQSDKYQYKYQYHKKGASNWIDMTGWITSSSYTLYPARKSDIMSDTDSQWAIRLSAKNSSGQESSKTFDNITIGKPKITIDSFTAPDLVIGNTITLKTTLSGDSIAGFTYQYKYTYVDSKGSEQTITGFQSKASYTWSTSANYGNIPENSNCTLKVYVKEKDNKAKQVTKTTTIKTSTKTYPDLNISSFSVSKSGDYVGDKITLKASVSSGTSPFSFKFSYDDKKDGTEHTIKEFSNESSKEKKTTWDTSKLEAGEYTVRVTIKDKNNKTATKTEKVTLKSKSVTATVRTMEQSYTQNDGWTPNVRFEINISDKSTAPRPYKYQVQYKKSSDKKYKPVSNNADDFKTYGDSVQIETLPTSIDVGVYNYRLIVKDKNDKSYTINGSSTFEVKYDPIKFNFNVSTKEFLTGGGDQKTALSVTDVKGGSGNDIQYKFEYAKYADLTTASPKLDAKNVTWTVLKDWSEESNAELLIDKQEDAGYYAVRASVKNKDDKDNKKVVSKTIDKIKVKKPVEVSLTDINDLITKVDTWMNNSLTDTQRDLLKNWENSTDQATGKSCLEIYDYHYTDFQTAYDIAKDAANHDKSEYGVIYQNLDKEFTKMQDFFKSGNIPMDNADNSPVSFVGYLFQAFTTFLSQTSDCFKIIAGGEPSAQSVFASLDIKEIVNTINPIFKTIAYSLIVLLVGVNAIESAFQYELMTLRGGIKIAVRLLFAKIFVDLSITICQSILTIAMEWTTSILDVSKDVLNNLSFNLIKPSGSGIWIIGPIIDFINELLIAIILGIMFILLGALIFTVMAKLFIRSVEIAMLQCVAPPFFACLCGDTTKEYFKKFITTYLSTSLEVVLMALIFYIYTQYINQFLSTGVDLSDWKLLFEPGSGFLSFFVVSLGCSLLMIKTPKVLKNLVS